eukprot:maker-scaffold_6-snap-gene-20.55-mRNA-1 protein AED:0.00 eAED:0.00 QI:170/1/1/1/1/1/2/173/622
MDASKRNLVGRGSYRVEEVEQVKPEEFDMEEHFVAADDTGAEAYRNRHNLIFKINLNERPGIGALINSILAKRSSESVVYPQGSFIEYRTRNMVWKLGIVYKVVRIPPKDWDFERTEYVPDEKCQIYYDVGEEGMASEDHIRAPKDGLQAVFGKRPWLWQQITLLQLEKRIRFEEKYEHDYKEINYLAFAELRFQYWLKSFDNNDFKIWYDEQPATARYLLKHHIMTPFRLLEDVANNEKEWDFDDDNISVYTYLSVLGSGFFIALLTLCIQLVAPLLLVYNVKIASDDSPNLRFEVDATTGETLNGVFLPSTIAELFCITDGEDPFLGRAEGKILIAAVVLIYLGTLVPDTIIGYIRNTENSYSTYSKMNSIRNILWDNNDDTVLQQIGFKLDRVMNTGYSALLYTFMLYILLNTYIGLDLILTALAIWFIKTIDKRIANSGWFDGRNRWIRAGVVGNVLRANIETHCLLEGSSICKAYDIDKDTYKDVMGDLKGLKNLSLAKEDDENPRYMTKKERIFSIILQQAIKKRNKAALQIYRKKEEYFSYTTKILHVLGIRQKGIFFDLKPYRTWSRWMKLLYLPSVPTQKELDSKRESKAVGMVPMEGPVREAVASQTWKRSY